MVKTEINQSNTIEKTKKVTWLIMKIVGNGASFLYITLRRGRRN